jgi:DNA polymerase-3 subunit alpha
MEKEPVHFVHLHTHSHYSLLDGLSKVDKMIALAKEHNMPAVALTDHGAMYGAIDFYQTAVKAGVKPILGVETYVAFRTRHDKEPGIDNKIYHLTLLAKNNKGYQNLISLVTKAHLEGYYYKPRVDKDLLRMYSEGVIALSGCFGGELSRALRSRDHDRAVAIALEYQEIFGKENYYIEIMHKPEIEGHDEVEDALVALARELDIPLVATHDSHYLHKEDKKAHETLLGIQTGGVGGVDDGMKFEFDASFISTKEALALFPKTPDAVYNTAKIAAECNVELTLGKFIFPDFALEPGKTADQMLDELTQKGAKERGLSNDTVSEERRKYELEVIKNKNYAPYFLVVADLLRFAREAGIYTTVRGSAAGSHVAYLSGITNVDPIEFQLPFERFLNPFRPSAPDIDMDFADNRREEVIEYAKRKYGADKVAQIGTFGTMMARGSVRDVARALGKPYDVGDKISKLIPMGSQGFPMTIEHALDLEPDLKKMYGTDPEAREILDLAKKLEGCVRHVSVHAAGVVIAPKPLIEYVPTQFDPKGGKLITQYDMYTVGEDGVGLTKLDFLGIRNLAILGDAVRLVKEHRNIDIEIEKIPFDDKKTFAMLAVGATEGLFQLNGTGMTKHLIDLKPTTIHDINAMVALYRPGPMNNIPEYIARKQGRSKIEYFHPKAESFLAKSYGVLVYQDDLLYTALELAGYNWEGVDKFRKAVGKKIPAEMAKQHVIFVDGCQSHSGMKKEEAEAIWALFEPFQGYGFNKAHAACYGRVAYQTAYMKANFPAEYMTAVLTAESGDTDTIAVMIAECKRMKIPVLPPDINASQADFTVIKAAATDSATSVVASVDASVAVPSRTAPEDVSSAPRISSESAAAEKDNIRFGLHTIKNLGEAISDAIIAERDLNGPYKSYTEFLERVTHKDLNKKSLESLIRAGCFDTLGEERGVLLHNVDDALEYHKAHAREKASNQESLFSVMSTTHAMPTLRMRPAPEISQESKLAWEKELLGLYISGHPLEKHREKIETSGSSIKKLNEETRDGMATILAGIIEEHKLVITKKNEHMAFLRVADFTGSIEVVVFPRTFTEVKEFLVVDKMVAIKGKFSRRNDSPSVIAEKIKGLE